MWKCLSLLPHPNPSFQKFLLYILWISAGLLGDWTSDVWWRKRKTTTLLISVSGIWRASTICKAWWDFPNLLNVSRFELCLELFHQKNLNNNSSTTDVSVSESTKPHLQWLYNCFSRSYYVCAFFFSFLRCTLSLPIMEEEKSAIQIQHIIKVMGISNAKMVWEFCNWSTSRTDLPSSVFLCSCVFVVIKPT